MERGIDGGENHISGVMRLGEIEMPKSVSRAATPANQEAAARDTPDINSLITDIPATSQ